MARPSERPDGSGKTGSEELARVVRERRDGLGWTRQQLADATGIPYPTIAQIETAYRGVSPARLGVIARALGLDPKDLYDLLASEGEADAPVLPVAAAPIAEAPMTAAPESASSRSAAPHRGPSAQRFRAAGSWHDNPGFAAAAPSPSADRPVPASPPAPTLAPAAAPRREKPRPAEVTDQPDLIDRVAELVSSLPIDQRLEALSRVQHAVLDRIVQERTDDARSPT